jgi:hypothetical protein
MATLAKTAKEFFINSEYRFTDYHKQDKGKSFELQLHLPETKYAMQTLRNFLSRLQCFVAVSPTCRS